MDYVKFYNISSDKVEYYMSIGLPEKDAIREVLASKKLYYQPDEFEIRKFKYTYRVYILKK